MILAGLLAWMKLHTLTASTPASGVRIMQFWVEKTYVAGTPHRQQSEIVFGSMISNNTDRTALAQIIDTDMLL
jgi:hypothetical protein